jgi:hypothetical protein
MFFTTRLYVIIPPPATGSGESVFVIVRSGWSLGNGVAVGVLVDVGETVGVGVIEGVLVGVNVRVEVRVGDGVNVCVGGVPHVMLSDSGAPGVFAPGPSECFVDGFSFRAVEPEMPCTNVTVANPLTAGHLKSVVVIRPV